jgi:hypothetical protein
MQPILSQVFIRVWCLTALFAMFSGLGADESHDPFGWRLGPAAWSFNRFTFFEALDKTAALGLRYIEAFEGQRVSQALEGKMGADLSEAAIAQVRAKLASAGVKLTSLYIHLLPGDEAGCRKAFEFCRNLGIETIVSEPAPESFNVIEQLCDEYRINVATLHATHSDAADVHPLARSRLAGGGNHLSGNNRKGWQRPCSSHEFSSGQLGLALRLFFHSSPFSVECQLAAIPGLESSRSRCRF